MKKNTAASKKTTALATRPSDEQLAALKQKFPVDAGMTRVQLPRLGMYSQDKTEEARDPKTKKKVLNVIAEAGTFYTEREGTEEVDGKKLWVKDEIGTAIEGVILYQRKQLSFFDGEKFTNSPIYDEDSEIVPLFLSKAEVDRGTPAELKSRKQYQIVKNGKKQSALEDNKILYILYEGEVYQMSLRGTSMYSFKTYARNTENVPAVMTLMDSKHMEKGDIEWNQMTFEVSRQLGHEEVTDVLAKIEDIEDGIASSKEFFANKSDADDEAQTALDKF